MSFSTVVQSYSPYSWYRNNETSGSTLTDASGNSRNGTILGTVGYQQTGFSTDGNHSESIASVSAGGFVLNGGPGVNSSAFTLGFWWKPGSSVTNVYVASGLGNVSSTMVGWQLLDSGTNLQLLVSNSSGSFSTYNGQSFYQASNSSQGISANGPAQFYWLTYDGTGTWNVFLNGNTTQTIILTSAPLVVPTSAQYLGVASAANSATNAAPGFYQDIMTFNTVLNAAARQAIYNAAVPISGGTFSATENQSYIQLNTSGSSGSSYAIYRGTDPNFTANSSSLIANTSTMPYNDTNVSYGTEYYYGITATDGQGNYSASLPTGLTAVTGYPNLYVSAKRAAKALSMVFIGDSITWGAGVSNLGTMLSPTVPFFTVNRLAGLSGRTINAYNNGANGTTTTDWAPGGTLYNGASQASNASSSAKILMTANPSSQLVFNIMLGTNDSASTVTNNGGLGRALLPNEYNTKLTAIINQILTVDWPGAIVIVHYNKWYSPNTNNAAAYLQAGLSALVSYNNQIPSVVSKFPGRAFVGDTLSFDYFAQNYQSELLSDNTGIYGNFYLHPSGTSGGNGRIGTQSLGEFWASAINRILSVNDSVSMNLPASQGSAYQLSQAVALQTQSGIVNIPAGQSIVASYNESTD